MVKERRDVFLNTRLITQQGLSDKEVRLLIEAHWEMDDLIELVNKLDSEQDQARIAQLGKSIELLEFRMQKLWKFPLSEAFHTHWKRIRHCSCPRLDNEDCYGHHRIYSSACVVHKDKIGELNGK